MADFQEAPFTPTAVINEFQSYMPDFSIVATGQAAPLFRGRPVLNGGLFVGALPDSAAGVMTTWANPNPEDSIDLGVYLSKYKEAIGQFQADPISRPDPLNIDLLKEAGRTLRGANCRLLGGFVLLGEIASTEQIARADIVGFVSNTLKSVLLNRLKTQLADESSESRFEILTSDGRAEKLGAHILSGVMPPPNKIHKLFGLSRRAVKNLERTAPRK